MTTKPQNVLQQVTFMFQMSKSVGCPLTDDTPIVLTVLKLPPFIFKVYSSNLMKKTNKHLDKHFNGFFDMAAFLFSKQQHL